jgi:hypothetical protein
MLQLRSIVHRLVETTQGELRKELLLLDVDKFGNLVKGATALLPIE